MPWIKIDEATGKLVEVNIKGLKQAAFILKTEIAAARSSGCSHDLSSIDSYADIALQGQVIKPRDWNSEPLRGAFREGLLPDSLDKAYANFTFYSHGLLNGNEPTETRADGIYAFVDGVQ